MPAPPAKPRASGGPSAGLWRFTCNARRRCRRDCGTEVKPRAIQAVAVACNTDRVEQMPLDSADQTRSPPRTQQRAPGCHQSLGHAASPPARIRSGTSDSNTSCGKPNSPCQQYRAPASAVLANQCSGDKPRPHEPAVRIAAATVWPAQRHQWLARAKVDELRRKSRSGTPSRSTSRPRPAPPPTTAPGSPTAPAACGHRTLCRDVDNQRRGQPKQRCRRQIDPELHEVSHGLLLVFAGGGSIGGSPVSRSSARRQSAVTARPIHVDSTITTASRHPYWPSTPRCVITPTPTGTNSGGAPAKFGHRCHARLYCTCAQRDQQQHGSDHRPRKRQRQRGPTIRRRSAAQRRMARPASAFMTAVSLLAGQRQTAARYVLRLHKVGASGDECAPSGQIRRSGLVIA